MRTVLVPFNGKQYLAVDKVALSRTARTLLTHLPPAHPEDAYELERKLRPLLELSISNRIETPVEDRNETISGRYFFERQEGTLPNEFTPSFNQAFSRFLVRVMSLPLDEPQVQLIDGILMARMELEDIEDWPDKVKFP